MKIKGRKARRAITKSAYSNIGKSCRRVFFNYLEAPTEERGHYHVDIMYGAGSCILLKIQGTYFGLTARHVLDNNLYGSFQNESPFWISVKHKPNWDSMYDFLMPKYLWEISQLISDDTLNSIAEVDLSDLVLIEFFSPMKYHQPDHFIEVDSTSSVLQRSQFFEGQFLICSGYPEEKNQFNHTPVNEEFTHSTDIHRQSIPGIFIPDDNFGYIDFFMVDGDIQHNDMNGMSGGPVYNVQPKNNQVKLAGVAVTAGDNICRFIPAYTFIEALLNYESAERITIDPSADGIPDLEVMAEITAEYIKNHHPYFKQD